MSSTYTNSLKITQIGSGEQSGVWGNTTNTNWSLIEQAVAGTVVITMANANYTLSNLNGVSDEARCMVLQVTGTNSGIYQVVAPLVSKFYVITNSTSGGYAITIGASSGSVVTIPSGITAQVYCDGTNFYSAQTGSAGSFYVNGTLTAAGIADAGILTANSVTAGSLTVTSTAAFSVSPTAPTPTTGDSSTKLATTAFVAGASAISGQIIMWPTTSAPTGYLLCNGAAVSRTTYATLFGVVGTTFGSGDGSTTFNLPNYQDRMPIGVNSIAGSIGATGGSSTTTISQANLPNVNFTVTDPGHFHQYQYRGANSVQSGTDTPCWVGNSTQNTTTSTTGITVNSGGSGTALSTVSPYLGINFIIKT